MPAPHEVQLLPAAAPGAPANPGEHSHAERAALPLPAVVCPGTTAPLEVVPQAMHTVSAVLFDCEVENLPTAHSAHTDEPALSENLPAPQSWHVSEVEPPLLRNLPAPHAVQFTGVAAPGLPQCPGLHRQEACVLLPVVVVSVSEPHDVHD